MIYRLKIVPNATPSAEGHWIEAEVSEPLPRSWSGAEQALRPFLPADHHLVAFERKEP
jgi:hypothetical protein